MHKRSWLRGVRVSKTVFGFLLLACLGSFQPVHAQGGEVPAADQKKAAEAINPTSPQEQTPVQPKSVRVEAVASDGLSLDVADEKGGLSSTAHLAVKDSALQARVKQVHRGDQIQIALSSDGVLGAFSAEPLASPEELSPTNRIIVLVGSAGLLFLFSCLLTGFKPHQLIIGADNRYSNSKFQIALWFWVLISTYAATFWLRLWFGGAECTDTISIPTNLLMLSGMSALTFGGAAGITVQKAASGPGVKTTAAQPNFIFDLTHDDGVPAANGGAAVPPRFDFGDFQMLVITLIAVATYLVLVFNFLGTLQKVTAVALPDVDTTVLASFGLGQGAYLAKKAVGIPGQS